MARIAPERRTLDPVRERLVALLNGEDAHMGFEEAVDEFPDDRINDRAPNLEYTPWHLVEHLRITQWDILEYIRDAQRHKSPQWPIGYWPKRDATTTPGGFAESVDRFLADRAALEAIVRDPGTDLEAVLPGTPGHTIVREITIVGNHNSYHVGEFAILRQVMGTWPRNHR